MNQLDMKGRSAIVTGGASGIGLAIAKRLAQSGANVAIWDMNEKTMAEAAKSLGAVKTHTAKVDVSKIDQVEAAFKSTLAAFGKVDALVNSAGIAGKNAVTWELPADDWLRVHDINLNGVFYTCRTVAPHMIKNNYGRIVNIASIAGKEGNPNASAYSSSKAAVIGLTKSLGKETAKNGITVNCVTPAAVRTPIFDQVPQQPHRLHARQDPDGPLRPGRGNRRHRYVGMHRGLLLHHRRGVRPFRRTRNVLIR